MTKITYRLWAKIINFILFLGFLGMSVFAGFAYYVMTYTVEREQYPSHSEFMQVYMEDTLLNNITSQAYHIAYDYDADNGVRNFSYNDGLYVVAYDGDKKVYSDYNNEPYVNSFVSEVNYSYAENTATVSGVLTMHFYLSQDFANSIYDSNEFEIMAMDFLSQYYDYILPLGISAVMLTIYFFIVQIVMAGRKLGYDGVYLDIFDKLPLEVAALITIICLSIAVSFSNQNYNDSFFVIISFILLPIVFFSIVKRIKARTLLKNTLVYIVCRFVWRVCKFVYKFIASGVLKSPLVVKTLLFYLGWQFARLILFAMFGFEIEFIMLFTVLEVPVICFLLIMLSHLFSKLHKATKLIASGDFDTGVDTKYMFMDFLDFAGDLNRVSDGMNVAVDEKLKSERLKTELITNVSHDIKTPLTSIINYVDLIKKEESDNENIQEYTEVLERQSHKLNKLIQDLVEASKISTGNISVDMQATDLCVIAQQIDGEYNEKLAENSLELLLSLNIPHAMVMADSRHLQRIFDNVMSNVIKYSLSGTRVYIDIQETCTAYNIIIKNTSATQLNISADELMERFVRGDSSRNTDGNGLGLSIAQSLATAQGAVMDIKIDGDLFKVIISFDKTAVPPTTVE